MPILVTKSDLGNGCGDYAPAAGAAPLLESLTLPKPASGLGPRLRSTWRKRDRCADLAQQCRRAPAPILFEGGKAVPAASPPQRQSAGPWLTRLAPCAAHPSRRFPLPPYLPGVLGRPCSGRWHGPRRTGALKGVKKSEHANPQHQLNTAP